MPHLRAYIVDVCSYVCHICKSLASTRSTVHIFCNVHFMPLHISLIKYGCHIANIAHTAFILYRLTEPTMMHLCQNTTKMQHLLHRLLAYTCRKQIWPPNWTHAKYLAYTYVQYMSIYMPHMKVLASNMWPRMIYTDDKDNNDTKDDANNKNDLIFQSHRLRCPMGQISQKDIQKLNI